MPDKPEGQHSTEKGWYYLLDGEKRGPVPGAELRRLLRLGELGPDTLVWRQGMRDWLPVRSIQAGVVQHPPAAAPEPPVQAANSVHVVPRARAAARVDAAESLKSRSRASRRHWLRVLGGFLAAIVILACGMGIGYVLWAPGPAGRPVAPAIPRANGQPVRIAEESAAEVRRPAGTADPSSVDAPSARPGQKAPAESRESAAASNAMPPVPESTPLAGGAAPSAEPDEPDEPATGSTESPSPGADSTLYQLIDILRRSETVVAGIPIPQEMRYQILVRLGVAPRQTDGTRYVTQKIEQVRLQAADDISRATYESSLNKLVGQQYSFTLNARDEIEDFAGFQPNTTNVPISRPNETGFLLATVIDEDGWKELSQRAFLRPPQNLAPGQTWRSPMIHNWRPLGSWRGTTTYTPRGLEGYGMRYDFAHEMSYVPPEPTAGVMPFQVTGAEFQPLQASGSFVFDAQQGRVVSVREVFHVRGKVAAGWMGSDLQIQAEEYQEFAVEISNQNPWQPGG